MADSKTKDSAQEINIEELVAKYVDQYENMTTSSFYIEFLAELNIKQFMKMTNLLN